MTGAIAGGLLAAAFTLAWLAYRSDLQRELERISSGSQVVETRCGPIEYASVGDGPAVQGMLAFLAPPFPRYVFAIPIAWAFIGSQGAFLLGVYEDLGLLVAGPIGVWLAFDSRREARHA